MTESNVVAFIETYTEIDAGIIGQQSPLAVHLDHHIVNKAEGAVFQLRIEHHVVAMFQTKAFARLLGPQT